MNPIRAALYTTLTGDGPLTALLATPTSVHYEVAPEHAQFPLIIFNRQAGTPEWQFRLASLQRDVWLVKAVDLASSASGAEDIAARIDVVLNGSRPAVDGRRVLAILRESDVTYPETDGADVYRHEGGLYRVTTEAT